MKFFHIFSVLISLCSLTGFAQAPPCIIYNEEEVRQWSLQDQKGFQDFLKTFDQKKAGSLNSIPMKAHIIRKSNGTGGLSEEDFWEALDIVNRVFEPAGIQFYHCGDIHFINSTSLANIPVGYALGDSLLQTFGVDSVVNVFFPPFLEIGYAGFAGGYDPYELVFVGSSYAKTNVFAHELGHYFRLFHTHNGTNEQFYEELVDGSNCVIAGDALCDTPADPELSVYNVNHDCEYFGTEQDANGDTYHPLPDNIMSYSPLYCSRQFTNQQYAKMLYTYLTFRSYLRNCQGSAYFSASPLVTCSFPSEVQFSAEEKNTPEYFWDFENDGVFDAFGANPSFTYNQPGSYDVRLCLVIDGDTLTHIERGIIQVGSQPFPYQETFEKFPTRFGKSVFSLKNGWETFPEKLISYETYGWEAIPLIGYYPPNTGPVVDHTNPNGLGICMVTDAGYQFIGEDTTLFNGDTASLISPCLSIPSNSLHPKVSWWHHLHGESIKALHVDLYDGQQWIENIAPPLVGEQQPSALSPWEQTMIDVSAYKGKTIRIRFRSIKGETIDSDIALDDFLVWEYPTVAWVLPVYDPGVSVFQPAPPHLEMQESGGDGETDCMSYKDYRVGFSIFDTIMGGNALVLVSVSGGNAEQGRDYDIVNNVVALPKSNLDTAFFILRVYDDAAVEEKEEIQLSFQLVGNTNAAMRPHEQMLTVFLDDNDVAPDPAGRIGQFLLLEEDFETGVLPTGWQRQQVAPSLGWIFTIPAGLSQTPGTIPDNGTGKVAGTNNDLCDPPGIQTCVAEQDELWTPLLDVHGLQELKLSFFSFATAVFAPRYFIDVQVNGVWQEGVEVLAGENWKWNEFDLSSFLVESDSLRFRFRYNSMGDVHNVFAIDNVKIEAWGAAAPVATALNSFAEAPFGPAETIIFYDENDGKLIAKLENQTPHDFGCLTAVLDRSGNGALPFETVEPGDFLSEKTLFLFPSNPAPVGMSFRLSMYLMEEEIAGWENATGRNRSELNLVRSPGAIHAVSPGNPDVNGENEKGSFAENGSYAESGWWVSASFSSFGGFACGDPAGLPTSSRETRYAANLSALVFPNPTHGKFWLHSYSEQAVATALVMNAFGEVVHRQQVSGAAEEFFNLPAFQPGVYFLHLTNEKGARQIAQKVVIY